MQADGLLALFLQLEIDIDGAFLGVLLELDGFIGVDFVEIIELVEAQDADVPIALIEELAFVDEQFAADDFVAGGGVAAEIDAADVVLLFFVEAESEIDFLGGFVDVESGSAVKSMKPYWP